MMKPPLKNGKLRAAIYTRVSTDEQAKEGFSLASQKDRLRLYARAQGWKVQIEAVDDGYTGRNVNRPGYQRLLERREAWDVLLVVKMDRIHRNSRNFLDMMDLFEKEGKLFASITESLDTGTAIGRFVLGIIAGIAQLESGQTGERVQVAIEQKLKDTNKIHGAPTFGYRRIKGRLVKHPQEAQVIQWMCQQTLAGVMQSHIATVLNKKGIKTRNGHPWTGPGVGKLLSHPMIAGCRLSHVHPRLNNHEPLVDLPTFWNVQTILDGRREKHRPDAENTRRSQRLEQMRRLMDAQEPELPVAS